MHYGSLPTSHETPGCHLNPVSCCWQPVSSRKGFRPERCLQHTSPIKPGAVRARTVEIIRLGIDQPAGQRCNSSLVLPDSRGVPSDLPWFHSPSTAASRVSLTGRINGLDSSEVPGLSPWPKPKEANWLPALCKFTPLLNSYETGRNRAEIFSLFILRRLVRLVSLTAFVIKQRLMTLALFY